MKIKCADAKHYSLTEGAEYDVVKQEQGWYFITNDNGAVKRYAKELFIGNAKPAAKPKPKPKPNDTLEAVINSINENHTEYTYNGEKFKILPVHFVPSNLSAGVGVIRNFGSMVDKVHKDNIPAEYKIPLATLLLIGFINDSPMDVGSYLVKVTDTQNEGVEADPTGLKMTAVLEGIEEACDVLNINDNITSDDITIWHIFSDLD